MTAKRGKKRDAGYTTHKLIKRKELTVKRLSSRYQEKPKSTPEFVLFTENELTIENIKRCCERNFATQVGNSLVCDILAGEQGPSCKTLEQIPDMKIIYMRFVTGNIQDCVQSGGQYKIWTADYRLRTGYKTRTQV